MKITLKIQESHLNRDHDFLFETVREELREFLPPTTVSVELGSEDGAGGKIFRVILPDPCPVPRGVILDVNFQFEVCLGFLFTGKLSSKTICNFVNFPTGTRKHQILQIA